MRQAHPYRIMYMKGALSGFWSRRISEAHRMVYRATSGDLQIAQLGYHD